MLKIVNIVVKVALVGLLLLAVAFPDWEQFAGKGIATRLLTYPLSALIVPGVWLLAGKARRDRWREAHGYPYWTDILITAPFMLDTLGNALNLFDTIVWWDDWMHFMNWAILCGGIGTVFARMEVRLPGWVVATMIAGLGALIAVFWEVGEYFAFIRHHAELETAYTDTLGDLALGSTGALLAGVITIIVMRRNDQKAATGLATTNPVNGQ